MKVSRDTPGQLILEETPWFLGIMLILFILAFVGPGLLMLSDGAWVGLPFGLAGGGLGLAALAVFVERRQVILDRGAGTVTLRSRRLTGYRQTVHRLGDVRRAVLEHHASRDGRRTSRVALSLSSATQDRLPLTDIYSSGRAPARDAAVINRWLGLPADLSPED